MYADGETVISEPLIDDMSASGSGRNSNNSLDAFFHHSSAFDRVGIHWIGYLHTVELHFHVPSL